LMFEKLISDQDAKFTGDFEVLSGNYLFNIQ
jgi:hypothetical protein